MGLDLASQFVLALFAGIAAGGLAGWLVGRFARFEIALGCGLLVPGVVALLFAGRFALAWIEPTTSPTRTPGRVVAIEQRPAGEHAATPVAVVEYRGAGGPLRATSGGGTALHEGDPVVGVAGAVPPRVGVPSEMGGGLVAAVLFGTFPLSMAAFFLGDAWLAARPPNRRRAASGPPTRLLRIAHGAMAIGALASGLLASAGWPVERALLVGFGLVALGLWLHVAGGLRARAPRWSLATGVLAANFTVWALALVALTALADPLEGRAAARLDAERPAVLADDGPPVPRSDASGAGD